MFFVEVAKEVFDEFLDSYVGVLDQKHVDGECFAGYDAYFGSKEHVCAFEEQSYGYTVDSPWSFHRVAEGKSEFGEFFGSKVFGVDCSAFGRCAVFFTYGRVEHVAASEVSCEAFFGIKCLFTFGVDLVDDCSSDDSVSFYVGALIDVDKHFEVDDVVAYHGRCRGLFPVGREVGDYSSEVQGCRFGCFLGHQAYKAFGVVAVDKTSCRCHGYAAYACGSVYLDSSVTVYKVTVGMEVAYDSGCFSGFYYAVESACVDCGTCASFTYDTGSHGSGKNYIGTCYGAQ